MLALDKICVIKEIRKILEDKKMKKFSIKELIYQSYQLSFSNFAKLCFLIVTFALLEVIAGSGGKNEYVWLLPEVEASRQIVFLSIGKILFFSLFIICWAAVISKRKIRLTLPYYTKIAAFISIWLIWHYVSFLGIYNLYFQKFAPLDLFIIAAGAYLPFIWVRFYSMLARLLDNQEIGCLAVFFHLTQGQVIRICIALLFVVVPCSVASWSLAAYYDGNVWMGDFILNMILLFFTTIWINHCYAQRAMLGTLAQQA